MPRRAVPASLALVALLGALTGCSPLSNLASAPRTAPASMGTGVTLQRSIARTECQKLVVHDLKLSSADTRKWSNEHEQGVSAHWLAAGIIATHSRAYSYQCSVKSDSNGIVEDRTLDFVRPA